MAPSGWLEAAHPSGHSGVRKQDSGSFAGVVLCLFFWGGEAGRGSTMEGQ